MRRGTSRQVGPDRLRASSFELQPDKLATLVPEYPQAEWDRALGQVSELMRESSVDVDTISMLRNLMLVSPERYAECKDGDFE
ncbi:MAG: hypothetical protein COW24_05950 [Candidatus Kerfeldbacteria bacterium CG15_BIG_FIL_POST_REV_8_21_14_020_45_12]|uniref:Uncharacterized protein n=1 Tax=Candidatus Kerfeldbacteria bacterium CG15_BIG_FIL_POST_REV_8_21_14_020_45_12 TaxID=2014247 RepID=A0A2M7H270_9BACT|nr:MAG: hypothetical protein COW24_05950 [Candidatus Kerfeldbacteria bacterium CG15_BIG_FIL_POST_REV_8_21_14_020_45_12]PJA92968.1 MAG: hypothetical protein CO132_05200 [Candidatus Kerfeldbacteria bacterium CG_4_9_14_3_um_filter_45_8]